MGYGERLASERRRLGKTQSEFAALVGTDSQKQSLYETSKRELRGDYLSAIAAVGVDVLFVLTGNHQAGGMLDAAEAEILQSFRALPFNGQCALRYVAGSMQGGKATSVDGMIALPSEDALARMFEAMLLPLDLGDALSDTARTFAQQLPASLDAAGPGRPPQTPTPTPVPDKQSPKPATPRRAS